MTPRPTWICCQLGAREHYAVPRALHRYGQLAAMITDAWTEPGHPISHIPVDLARRLAERYHPDLDSADVHDLTISLIRQEVEWRLQRRKDWDVLIARNEWFQREAAAALERVRVPQSRRVAVFAHSYSARDIFRAARKRGWTTVLGQIDPGEEHFTIVRRLADASPQYGPPPPGPPIGYFESWREECALADHIVVNSEWTRRAITRVGIDARKVHLVPLAYENSETRVAPDRSYPDRFTAERPMKLLFVGSVSVVKGVPELLGAMTLLSDLPVTLQLVGAAAMNVTESATCLTSVKFVGPVQRGEIVDYYDSSDVLVFPSHSDGFGMAQIEAQGRGLPIIASATSGRVVEDGVNGVLLPEVSARAIAERVRVLFDRPAVLRELSSQALRTERSTLLPMGEALIRLVVS